LRSSVSTVDVYDKHDTCVECTERAHMGTKECTEQLTWEPRIVLNRWNPINPNAHCLDRELEL